MPTVVIGSGPGGASVARELARGGERVIILERGRDWRGSRLFGTYAGALLYADRHALLFTDGGLNIIRPLMLGGATSMYCGCAAPPPDWWRSRLGIDLDGDVRDITRELEIRPLPPELRGAASTRIAEAAGAMGQEWVPQDKFMRPERATEFDCGAHCMLGCTCGAKWSAAEWIDDAVRAGAELRTRTHVQQIRIEGGAVAGVSGSRAGRPFSIDAERVIVAAGGIGTAVLLRASGIEGAGRGMTMDTTAMVYGHSPIDGIGQDPPMTWSHADDDLGVLYSTLLDPWLMYPLVMSKKGPAYPLTWHRWGRTLGVMIKLKDEVSGEISEDGTISKGVTTGDRHRLSLAEDVAGEILRRAGCRPDSIFTTPLRGTHPAGTVRIGEVVDARLRADVRGLYVCDASVFPEALARPTVLTILALGRRLARDLLRREDDAGQAGDGVSPPTFARGGDATRLPE